MVIIEARAKKADHIGMVGRSQSVQSGADFHFAEAGGQIKTFGAHVGRDIGKEVIQRTRADNVEHGPGFFLCMRDVRHDGYPLLQNRRRRVCRRLQGGGQVIPGRLFRNQPQTGGRQAGRKVSRAPSSPVHTGTD